ncbi:MAG: phosphoglycolate phosphatase [Pseudomonadota bacterium]
MIDNLQNPSIGDADETEMPEVRRQSDTLTVGEDELKSEGGKDEAKKIRYRAKPKFPLPVPAKVFLLDLDGTLLDTAGDITTAANRMREAFGFGPLETVVVRNFIGRGIANLVSLSMKNAVGELGAGASKVAVTQFEKQYELCLADTTQTFPGVFEGLELFREKGFKLACITNKATRFTLPLLEKTGLAPYFELVLSGDSLAEKKPHPLPIQHAAKHFGVRLEEVVMIGDSMHDAEAARAAGCPVFIVPYGYNEGQSLRGLDCDAFIDDLPGALKYAKISL